MMTSFSVYSLNCEGLKRSSSYIKELLKSTSCDILCLQETWLLESNNYLLSNIDSNYLYTAISGVDSSKEILKGRPSGGVAILYKKNYF